MRLRCWSRSAECPCPLLLLAIRQGCLLQGAVAIGLGLPGSERFHFLARCLEISLEDRISLKPGGGC